MNQVRLLLPILAVVTWSACSVPERAIKSPIATQSDSLARTPIPGELDKVNQLFLGSYKTRREAVKRAVEPLIVADFDTLTLTWKGVTTTNEVLPDLYHSLKSVAHVPFGLFLELQGVAKPGGGVIGPALAARLQAYRQQIAATVPALGRAGFTPEQQARQEEILRRCTDLCDRLQRTSQIDSAELNQFARALGPALLANTADAARVQLDATHAVVMRWRQLVPPEHWRKLHVVVRGPQTPRRLNVFTQYFARVVDEPGHHLGYPLESRRLVYAEYLLPGRDELDLLATTLMDGDASEVFFGDRRRLGGDLLADAVQAHLRRLKF